LPSVIQSIQPYVSSEDIDKGSRWSSDIAKELENSTFGIICVTKDNFEAPWLSFEAGALSKTMDKSFVTPFLFDIKRSEVKGPLLQFQSTIFQKEDLKKLIGTLNKACGENKINEERLNKAFDVWYPTLEKELNTIKGETEQSDENKIRDGHNFSLEILEEILELSRSNQKLLRNTEDSLSENESSLSDNIEDLKKTIQTQTELIERFPDLSSRRRMNRLHPMLIEELTHFVSPNSLLAMPMLLSPVKIDFPWIYDSGIAVYNILMSDSSKEEKRRVCRDFEKLLEFTTKHPIMRDMCVDNPDIMMLLRHFSTALVTFLKEIVEKNIGR